MAPEEFHDLAYALDALAKLRDNYGLVPGAAYDKPRVHLLSQGQTWVLTWVEGTDDGDEGHYTAALEDH